MPVVRLALLVVAGMLCALLAGPAWAMGSPSARFWFPESASSFADRVDGLFVLILWITGIIFVLVEGVLLWSVIRFRKQDGKPASYMHGNTLIEVIWTVVPAAIVLYLALASQRVWSHIQGTPPPHALEIEVKGEQFAWNVRYPGADGQLQTEDDIETINQLHLPLNEVVLIRLTSKDVIHSFFLPHFRMKRDAVPGLTGRIWLQPIKAGQYEIACAELCGLGHYRMRGFLVVESPEQFQAWLTEVEQSG